MVMAIMFPLADEHLNAVMKSYGTNVSGGGKKSFPRNMDKITHSAEKWWNDKNNLFMEKSLEKDIKTIKH